MHGGVQRQEELEGPAEAAFELPPGCYRLRLDADGYLPVGRYETIAGDRAVTVPLPLDPAGVTGIRIRPGAPEGIAELSRRQAAMLLNVLAKIRALRLGRFLQAIEEFEEDRIWVRVPEGTEGLVRVDRHFHPVSGVPDIAAEGYDRSGSYETGGRIASLRLTFFRPDAGDHELVDVGFGELEEALGGVLDVVHPGAPGDEADPYLTHQMLTAAGIDPGYELLTSSTSRS